MQTILSIVKYFDQILSLHVADCFVTHDLCWVSMSTYHSHIFIYWYFHIFILILQVDGDTVTITTVWEFATTRNCWGQLRRTILPYLSLSSIIWLVSSLLELHPLLTRGCDGVFLITSVSYLISKMIHVIVIKITQKINIF